MLDIRIDGQQADLTPGTQLTLERFNSMFDFTTVPGTKVMDFSLPDTPTNRRIFGHPGHAQAPSPRRRWGCEKYLSTNLIETGYVKLKEISTSYSLYFTQNLGQIFGDYQDRLLSEITELGTSPAPAPGATGLPFGFMPIANPSFYGNAAPAGWNGIVNDPGTSFGQQVPYFFVESVLKRFGELTGWTFAGEFWESSFLKKLQFYNLTAIDGASSVVWSNHLPDLTAGRLLIELRNLFNLYLDFDVRRKICRIDLADSVLAADRVLDWTLMAGPGGVKSPDTNSRLELGYDLDSNDAELKPVPPGMDVYRTAETPLTEGATLLPIRSKFSTLVQSAGRYVTDQVGYSSINKDSKPVSCFRLLVSTENRGGVPLVVNGVGVRELTWPGENGLVNRFWQGYERFRADTMLVRKNVLLRPADLATFSFRNKVHISGVNYLVGLLKANLGNEGPVMCEVELWKL